MRPRLFPHSALTRVLLLLPLATTLPVFRAGAQPAGNRQELVLHRWSGSLNVPDPVACTVDPRGRVYVTSTTRRKQADLDIREHAMWIPNDVALRTVEEKSAFLQRELAPGKLRAPRGMLKDHNLDGSIDWKDLTVHTERIYRLADTDGDGTADEMKVFAEGFSTDVTGIAAGILYHDGWVYATIAPDLWRFKDTNDDGVADIREVVATGFGVHLAYAGHDMHGLSVGPDGRIYWSIGDKGLHVVSREGRTYSHPNEGAVMRVEPDGSGFEVYAHGLRNPQEPAFDPWGDLFAVDNDADMKGERERFVFIMEGSDTGWRCNYQYMKEASPWMTEGYWKPAFPGQAAHLLPPIENYSDGPAGFRFEPGTALGERQRGLFLLNEFPSGKMKAFRVEPVGASYRMIDARLLTEGVMGIGMSWHPDGSLLFVDWIGGYPLDGLGALWRVDTRDPQRHPARDETHRLLAAGFQAQDDAQLTTLLHHADQRVRLGAQFELVRRGRFAGLLATASDPGTSRLARVHALWGYGQGLRHGAVQPGAAQALLRDADAEIRAQTAKIFGDAPKARIDDSALVALLRDPSPRVRVRAALAAGKRGTTTAFDALVAWATDAGSDPVIRQAIAIGLAGCARSEQLAALRASASPAVRAAAVVALRRQTSPLVQVFLDDPELLVAEEAARAIHDERGPVDALPALAARVGATPTSPPLERRALNANLRLGTPEAAGRLLTFALNEGAPRELRLEALESLALWNRPPSLDRVDGYARAYHPVPVGAVLAPRLDALLSLADSQLKTRAIEIMIAHGLQAPPDRLADLVATPAAPGSLRAETLRLLATGGQTHPAFARALAAALAPEAPAPLPVTALGLLLERQPGRFLPEAQTVLSRRTLAEKQQVFTLLSQAKRDECDLLIEQWTDRLLAGQVEPGLRLDVLEAAQARQSARPALAERVARYQASAAAQAQDALLVGGNPEAGLDLVANHLNANCLACHAVGNSGSEVGPNLRSIGLQRTRTQLLESLLAPSAAISPGFGIVSLTLKDGSSLGGTLASEDATTIRLRQFDGTFQAVPRERIASATPPVSIMPPMLGILQPKEVRDVVAYLSSLTYRANEPRPAAKQTE
ncbi:MAG: HEAT repeat domain-containing protein [Opitutaceae bacterium]|nr:HEAT repeat domain-containing protein [Opitutaceae bacterium]